MMFGYGAGGIAWIWVTALVVLVVALALILARVWNGGGAASASHEVDGILAARLARGDIGVAEHERLRTTLGLAARRRIGQRLAAASLALLIVLLLALGTVVGGPADVHVSEPWAWTIGHGMMGGWFAGGTPTSPVYGNQVAVSGGAFLPSNLIVSLGVLVSWTNHDSVGHTITATDGSWSSGEIRPGGTYSRTFTVAGAQTYFCRAHPWMRATLTIQG